MRRTFLRVGGRRHLVVLAIVLFILITTFHGSDHLPTYPQWPPTSVFSCPSNRNNPNRVQTPPAPNPTFTAEQWNHLRDLFDVHPPSPPHLDQPKHGKFPTKEQMANFFKLTDVQANATREAHRELMSKIPSYPGNFYSGRGVVMLAGGRYTEFAATSLGMLREVGSKLPVEVWSKDESEEYEGFCDEIRAEGMACRRLADYMDLSLLRHPYQWKIFTILFSSFKEILFLDADSMPILNPDFIFDSQVFKENGAILWPDYWKHSGSPWLPYLIGMKDESSGMLQDEQSIESGQIFWHKERHWKSLLLATYYNYFGPDFYYTVFNNGWAGWGDKDTFPMALKATKERYYQIPHGIVTVFVNGSQLGVGMVQANPANGSSHEPMFMHSNIIKWSMKNFLCKGDCKPLPGQKARFHLEDSKSEINRHLNEGIRIFATQQLFEKGIDPEPIMWKALEHTACRSVMGRPDMCQRARDHMQKTFGFRFEKTKLAKTKLAESVGYGEEICVIGP